MVYFSPAKANGSFRLTKRVPTNQTKNSNHQIGNYRKFIIQLKVKCSQYLNYKHSIIT